MPSNMVKTPKDEQHWEWAKEQASKSHNKSDPKYWGLVNMLYQKKKKKHGSIVESMRKYIEAAHRVDSILDRETINQGISRLQKSRDFTELKKQYSALKKDLMESLSVTEEKASSIINYAIHT